ncbi:MAG: hypothetical protein AAF333_08305 [Planctomycetota bacterium]
MNQPAPPPRPSLIWTLYRRASAALLLAAIAGAGLLGYQVARDRVAADVYLERYTELNEDHNELIDQYNQAVTRTAVTELLVDDGQVSVNVRTADGQLETHPVNANPTHPIYVDYVVKDGRLLIRRVFDSKSAPDDAGVIDSKLLKIDWSDPAVRHGQAIYRQLTDGRWIVTVSGDGSLSLAKVEADVDVELLPAPQVAEFDPINEINQDIDRITPADVFRRLFGG